MSRRCNDEEIWLVRRMDAQGIHLSSQGNFDLKTRFRNALRPFVYLPVYGRGASKSLETFGQAFERIFREPLFRFPRSR